MAPTLRRATPADADRIRALVRPAIDEARQGGEHPKFNLLRQDTEMLTREPTGVGLDVPAWLVALEDEVDDALRPAWQQREDHDLACVLPARLLSYDEARRQLEAWTSRE